MNYEETKARIQEELISIIVKDMDDAQKQHIRFWKPEERIPDEQILDIYPAVYSIMVKYEYKASKFPIVKTIVFKNFEAYDTNNGVALVFLNLDPNVLASLRSWCKRSAQLISNYFKDEELYYLREVSFEFLPEDKNKTYFIVPNLPLENVKFSSKKKGPIIEASDYVNSKMLSDEDIQRISGKFKR